MTTKQEALAQLCLHVLPIWARQLATSRTQSEAAVSEMLGAFAVLGPCLTQASRQSAAIARALDGDAVGVGAPPSGLRGLVAACEQLAKPLLSSLDEQAAMPLHQMLQLIRDASAAVESAAMPGPLDTGVVDAKIEQMYVGFQYQDRINQVMALLQEDMGRLHKVLDSAQDDVNALSVEPWLARLASSYAMAEQHHDHTNDDQSDASHDDGAGTSFF